MRTIDITPTWSGVLPLLLTAYTDGTDEGRRLAMIELRNMAKAADLFNELTRDEPAATKEPTS